MNLSHPSFLYLFAPAHIGECLRLSGRWIEHSVASGRTPVTRLVARLFEEGILQGVGNAMTQVRGALGLVRLCVLACGYFGAVGGHAFGRRQDTHQKLVDEADTCPRELWRCCSGVHAMPSARGNDAALRAHPWLKWLGTQRDLYESQSGADQISD